MSLWCFCIFKHSSQHTLQNNGSTEEARWSTTFSEIPFDRRYPLAALPVQLLKYLLYCLPNPRLTQVGVYILYKLKTAPCSQTADNFIMLCDQHRVSYSQHSHTPRWFKCLTTHSSPATPIENLNQNSDNLLGSSWWTLGINFSSTINTWTFMSAGCIHALTDPVLLWGITKLLLTCQRKKNKLAKMV